MRTTLIIVLLSFSLAASNLVLAAKVTRVPGKTASKFDIDTRWYKKYAAVKGIPIVASRKVSDRALLKSVGIMNQVLFGNRFKIAPHLIKYRAKMAIVARGQHFSNMPEISSKSYDHAAGLACCGYLRWNQKSNSWKRYYQTGFTRETNALQLPYPRDKWGPGNSVLIHEFAHVIHESVFENVYSKISKLITRAYNTAKKKGLWKGAYAMTNKYEYFAEGSERWFNVKTREGEDYFTTGGPYPHNRKELKKHDIRLYKLLKRIYGNRKWRFRYGKLCTKAYELCDNKYKLSAPFGPSLARAASQNAFMVGEDFDLKVATTGSSFSFDDYSYVEVPNSSKWTLGFKEEQDDLPQMGGNFAFGYQLGGIQYRVAADNTFLGSKGSGWLGYKDARSAYVSVGKRYSLGNKWNISGDVTYGWSQANAEREGVFQDFSKVHALGFNASAGYQLNTNNAFGISLNSPLKVEKGSLIIKSPYDAERVNLSPSGRQVDVGVSFQHQIDAQRSVSAGITYINDYHHDRDVTRGQVMLNYRGSF
ncbi:MAG: hypothetical protein CMN58_06030 [Solibacterales bacterium]|nr:hypothetical protein [Bryobacterales bacterium]